MSTEQDGFGTYTKFNKISIVAPKHGHLFLSVDVIHAKIQIVRKKQSKTDLCLNKKFVGIRRCESGEKSSYNHKTCVKEKSELGMLL